MKVVVEVETSGEWQNVALDPCMLHGVESQQDADDVEVLLHGFDSFDDAQVVCNALAADDPSRRYRVREAAA